MEKNNFTTIKLATLSNLDDILKILNTLDTQMISKENLICDLQDKNSKYYLIFYKSALIGFAGVTDLIDVIDLNYIAILKEYRQKGYGKFLFKYICQDIKKDTTKKIMLEVRVSNINAISFYEGLGFRKISVRKAYYKDTMEDAYIYEKLI